MSLLQSNIRRVPAEGPKDATVILVGEAPGQWEVNKLRPFYPQAPAGSVLEECLHAAGLIRSECFLTNVWDFKVVKKKGKGFYDQEGNLLYTEPGKFTKHSELSLARLFKEIKDNNASTVVAMGNPALAALVPEIGEPKITKRRGSIYWSARVQKKVIATPHTSSTLQSGDYLARYLIVFDLRRAKEEGGIDYYQPIQQKFIFNPTFKEAMYWLVYFKQQGLKGKRLNFDIELLNEEVCRISFACDLFLSVSIPYDSRWTVEEETDLWRATDSLLGDERIAKCNENILFDAFVLGFKNNIYVAGKLDDPMTANHIIYPDFRKSLAFLTSIWTKIPYYKDTGKVWQGKDLK